MDSQQDRRTFENLACAGLDEGVAKGLGSRLRGPPQPAVIKALAALWLHTAVAAPERARSVLDAVAEGYLGEGINPKPGPAAPALPPEPEPAPAAFWAALWDLVDAPRPRQGNLNLVSRNAALAALLSPRLSERAAKSCMALPGVAAGFAQGYPRSFSGEALARCAKGSLGGALHQNVKLAGGDLALPDRETLEELPPPLPYLYARLQQCHRLWQLVGGYGDTALHEAAILGFQLAQCGHPRAALRLGTMFTLIAFESPEGAAIMMRTLLDAWIHGRRTPSLLSVNWPSIWNKPLERVRAQLGVSPFVSVFPADLFERIAA